MFWVCHVIRSRPIDNSSFVTGITINSGLKCKHPQRRFHFQEFKGCSNTAALSSRSLSSVMEGGVAAEDIHLEQEISGQGLSDCLQKIKEDEERNKQEKGKKNKKRDKEIEEDPGSEDQEDDSDTDENKSSLADELLDALHKNDALKVWELVERNDSSIKRLEDLDKICAAVVERDNDKEKRRNRNGCLLCCGCFECCGCCKDTSANEHQRKSNEQLNNKTEQPNNKKNNDEEKRKWIKISSNPLFISVEWLCRTKGQKDVTKDNNNNDNHKEKDIIKFALDNAYLLEKMASYEHHYSREDYQRAGEAYETFAVDVMEGSTSSERYEDQIMDIEGNGCLLTGESKNFIQSLSLLKIAANRGRKKVCIVT